LLHAAAMVQYFSQKRWKRFTVVMEEIQCRDELFDRIVMSYDKASGKYGIYFSYNKETMYMLPNDADLRFIS